MGTAKMVIPVGDLDWEDQATSLVDVPPPSAARPPEANRTRRMDKVDPMLLALTRGRSIGPSAPPKEAVAPKKADSSPVPPKAYASSRATAMPVPQRTDSRPSPPRPLAVRPFMHRPFAMQAPPPRARPALPTHIFGSANAEIPRSELFARDLAPATAGRLTMPTMPKAGIKAPPPSERSSSPPSASYATMPAPPPEMTGAIVLDEKMFEEAFGGRIHMNGASIIPSNLDLGLAALEEECTPISLVASDVVEDEIFQPTGTIDVDGSWLEESQLVDQEIEPESFWMRGKR